MKQPLKQHELNYTESYFAGEAILTLTCASLKHGCDSGSCDYFHLEVSAIVKEVGARSRSQKKLVMS